MFVNKYILHYPNENPNSNKNYKVRKNKAAAFQPPADGPIPVPIPSIIPHTRWSVSKSSFFEFESKHRI